MRATDRHRGRTDQCACWAAHSHPIAARSAVKVWATALHEGERQDLKHPSPMESRAPVGKAISSRFSITRSVRPRGAAPPFPSAELDVERQDWGDTKVGRGGATPLARPEHPFYYETGPMSSVSRSYGGPRRPIARRPRGPGRLRDLAPTDPQCPEASMVTYGILEPPERHPAPAAGETIG